MNCNCIKLVNEQLKARNAKLDTAIALDFTNGKCNVHLPLALVKIDAKIRKPLPTIVATFCPVCGKRANKPPAKKRKTAKAKA